uniref:RNA polymerase I and III subunit D n=3 Tax=Sus scrofa TaxID=9823 RepID=A0A4X1TN35_PIG
QQVRRRPDPRSKKGSLGATGKAPPPSPAPGGRHRGLSSGAHRPVPALGRGGSRTPPISPLALPGGLALGAQVSGSGLATPSSRRGRGPGGASTPRPVAGPCRAAAAPPPSFRPRSFRRSFLPFFLLRPHASRYGAEPSAGRHHLRIPEAAPAMEEDQELERKAIEELLKEAKRGKTRAETMGPMGWMKCPLAGTNKRFLINTIKNTLPSHKEQDHEPKEASAEPAKSQSQKEEGRQKHRPHPYKPGGRAGGAARRSPGKRGQEKPQPRSHTR